jgi:hypothetical protein
VSGTAIQLDKAFAPAPELNFKAYQCRLYTNNGLQSWRACKLLTDRPYLDEQHLVSARRVDTPAHVLTHRAHHGKVAARCAPKTYLPCSGLVAPMQRCTAELVAPMSQAQDSLLQCSQHYGTSGPNEHERVEFVLRTRCSKVVNTTELVAPMSRARDSLLQCTETPRS